MPGQSDKGKFSADIAQDVIDEALKSVARRTGETPVDAPDAPTEEVPVVVEGASLPLEESPPAPAALRTELEETKAQLELSLQKGREMMDKVKESHERMLRAAADLENFKKRAQKEKEELQKFGSERLLKDFLPVLDNLDRALEHAAGQSDVESVRKGVTMTRKLFEDTLSKHGVKGFTSLGKPFDPRFHEAMSQVETAELPPQHVAAEAVRGYTLNDRLIRPALVTVSLAPAGKVLPPEPVADGTPAQDPSAPKGE